LRDSASMDQFLKGIEGRAFRIAELATSDKEEALELVQEAMIKLVQNYSDKPAAEWAPLFHRILQSKIKDWYRYQAVRNRFKGWFGFANDNGDEDGDPISQYPDRPALGPEALSEASDFHQALEVALKALPLRQQQAFLLRTWEGLSVKQTAEAMSCSEGSVKTHYSRANKTLQSQLEDFRP